MSRIKQLAGQTVVYGGGHILSKIVFYLLVNFLLLNLLNERNEEYGTFSWYYGYSAIFVILFSFRMDTALFRFGTKVSDSKKAFNTSFTFVLIASLFLLTIGVFAYKYIAPHTVAPNRPIYVRWFAFILAFDILALIPYAKLRLDNQAKSFAVFKILNVLISSGLIIFFLVVLPSFPDSIRSIFPDCAYIIDYVFLSNLIASFVILILLILKVGGIGFQLDLAILKKMIFYVSPLVIVGVANSVIQYLAVPLQEQFLGPNEAENIAKGGTYEASRKIANLFAMFITAFNYAAEPFFFNNSSSSDRRLYYGKICNFFSLVGGLVILCIVFSLDAIGQLIGSSYLEGFFVIPILLIGYLFLGLYYNVSIWYKLSDNTKYGAYISTLGVITFLCINILLLPLYGYVVTAWATLITYSLMVVVAYIIGQKLYPIDYPIKKIIVNLIIVSGIVVTSVYLKPEVTTTIYYVFASVTVCLYMWYAYKVEEAEWDTILKIRKT